jgi:hypothetical protein
MSAIPDAQALRKHDDVSSVFGVSIAAAGSGLPVESRESPSSGFCISIEKRE